MLNSLKIHAAKQARFHVPELEDQIRILSGLLKMKHFDAIWCNQGLLTVRRFADHFEVPEYLPWKLAAAMVDAAGRLEELRKSAVSEAVPMVKAAGA